MYIYSWQPPIIGTINPGSACPLFDSRKQRSKPSILYHPLDSLVGQQGDPVSWIVRIPNILGSVILQLIAHFHPFPGKHPIKMDKNVPILQELGESTPTFEKTADYKSHEIRIKIALNHNLQIIQLINAYQCHLIKFHRMNHYHIPLNPIRVLV